MSKFRYLFLTLIHNTLSSNTSMQMMMATTFHFIKLLSLCCFKLDMGFYNMCFIMKRSLAVLFLVATVTNHHNTHLFSYSSGRQKSKMSLYRLKLQVSVEWVFPGGSRGESVQLFWVPTVSCLWPYYSSLCFYCHIAFSSYKDSCDYTYTKLHEPTKLYTKPTLTWAYKAIVLEQAKKPKNKKTHKI